MGDCMLGIPNSSTAHLAVLVWVSACGARPAPTTTATSSVTGEAKIASEEGKSVERREPVFDLEPLRIRVIEDESGERRLIHYDARMLLDQGNDALASGDLDRAIARYDTLISEFPESALVVAAVYNAGLAHEGKGEYDRAIARYRAVLARQAKGRDSVDAHVRIAMVLSEQARWAAAQETLEEILQRSDLSATDQVECKARLGYVLIEQGLYARAERVLSEALAYADSVTRTSHLETDYYVAMASYYLGNIPHRQALAIELRVIGPEGDTQLRADVVAKRNLLKLAYDRYVLALRRRNPYWATAAGYQMSQMFKDLWDDIVLAPTPPHLDQRESVFYVQEVHKFGRELLEKALEGHQKNVELAEAYRTSTPWSAASRRRVAEISQILAKESAGELVAPAPLGRRDTVPDPGQGRVAENEVYVPAPIFL